MNSLSANALFFVILFFHAKAQFSPEEDGGTTRSFRASLALVIGILSIMFFLTFALLLYAKLCHRGGRLDAVIGVRFDAAHIRPSSRFSGIDKTVIKSLPFFRFSALKGSKEGLECAVCLSKFEEIEILRLLPKCKHAFHINCIDHWLENNASCPLCRQKVSPEDLKFLTYSNSMRFLWNGGRSEVGEASDIELFVQREEAENRRSSRFSIGSSFRKVRKDDGNEGEGLIQKKAGDGIGNVEEGKALHKHNHKIIVSDLVFKNRWSNVSSSDIMFLNTEMLGAISSNRFSFRDSNAEQPSGTAIQSNERTLKIKEEIEMKRSFESKISTMSKSGSVLPLGFLPSSSSDSPENSRFHEARRITDLAERRSLSEITALSRFSGIGGIKNRLGECSMAESNFDRERTRKLWFPIARRTVQWFANRETRSHQYGNTKQNEQV